MRPNGTPVPASSEALQGGLRRVTSMARWLARRKGPAAHPAPKISVVMPVYNAEATLEECLAKLGQSTLRGLRGGRRRRRVDRPLDGDHGPLPGPGRSRRRGGSGRPRRATSGAQVATGEFLFFIDSDVMVRPDTLGRAGGGLRARRTSTAFCGVQAAEMRHRDLVQPVQEPVDALDLLEADWATCRSSTRPPPPSAGTPSCGSAASTWGTRTPNVEDTAFGQKLARLGVRVRVQPDLEVEHVKRYSLWSLLRTDFMRAVSLTRLKLRHPEDLGDNNTSVPASYMASVPLSGLARASPSCSGSSPAGSPATLVGVLLAAGVIGLNAGFLDAIRRSDGWGRALAAVPVLWLELLVVGVGTARRARSRSPSADATRSETRTTRWATSTTCSTGRRCSARRASFPCTSSTSSPTPATPSASTACSPTAPIPGGKSRR